MEPTAGVIQCVEPKTPPALPSPTPSPLLTWPIGVQVALGFIITASLFFFLGRWSQAGPSPPIETAAATEPGPALDLNRATKAELRLIPGLGDALAQRIVDHRERSGPFHSVDELRKVAGIGPKTLDRLRHCLFVAPDQTIVASANAESAAPISKEPKPAPPATTATKKATNLTQPININLASQTELQKIPGIGPKLSQRILNQRAKAAFESVDDLRRVPGIGPKILAKLRPYVTIGDVQADGSSAQE